MADLYDAEGNVIEGALSPEEAAAIKAQAEESENLKAKLQETEEKLKGLETKDFNWRKFEEAKEDEKKKMLEGFTEKEQQAMKDKAEMMAKVEKLEGTIFEKDRSLILTQLAGSDTDLRAKIEEAAKKFAGNPSTVEEWQERYLEAATLIQGARPKVNPLSAYYPATEYRTPSGGTKFSQTAEGKAKIKEWFKVDLDKK